MPYSRYLTTPHWRRVRDAALRRAGFRCSKCSSKRDLQVHHLTYERRGAELDDDLEVLCRGCHLGLHVQEAKHGIGVYIKLVSDALAAETFETLPDLMEAVKCRCALAKIPYESGQVHAAVSKVDRDRGLTFAAPMPKKYAELLHAGTGAQPFTKAEAAGFIAELGLQRLLRPMPSVPRFTRRQADSLRVIQQIAALTIDQIAKCEEVERIAAEAETENVKR